MYEKRPDGSNQRIGSYPEKPSDAIWREIATGGRACLNEQGHAVIETLGCFMRLATTRQVGRFDFSKTALHPGKELATRSQRLSVDGGELKGSVLGLFQMTSRLETQGRRSWFLPVTILCGKLGEAAGPSPADVIACAQLRQAFLEGAPLPETPETPALTAPPREAGPRPIITSGRQALANPEPPPSPPPAEYAGPAELDDDIPF